MTRLIVVRPEAETDIAEAVGWYASRDLDLSRDFRQRITQSIFSIAENPFRFRKIYGTARHAPLLRFPYNLIYRVQGEEIVIVACMHVRRHPRHWQSRR